MANVNVRIDPKLKKQAENIFTSLGISVSSAINMFYRQVVRTNGIPFELKLEIPNDDTLAAIKEIEQMEKDHSKGEKYNSAKELMNELNKQ